MSADHRGEVVPRLPRFSYQAWLTIEFLAWLTNAVVYMVKAHGWFVLLAIPLFLWARRLNKVTCAKIGRATERTE